MPGFLGGLLGGVKEAFSFIQSGVKSGLASTSEFIETITSNFGLSEPEISQAITDQQTVENNFERIMGVPLDYQLPESMIAETDWDIRDQFLFKANVLLQNRTTGEIYQQWYSVGAEENMSMSEWLAELAYNIEGGASEPNADILDYTEFEAWQKPV